MRFKLFLLLIPMMLFIVFACTTKTETTQDWQKDVLDKQYQELTAQIKAEQGKSATKDKAIAQLTADKANLSQQVKQLQAQLSDTPTAKQLQSLRNDNTSLLQTLAVMQSDLERAQNGQGATSQDYDNLRAEYNRLVGLIQGVNNRTDEVLAADNVTLARNSLWFEKWDEFYEKHNLGQFQIRK